MVILFGGILLILSVIWQTNEMKTSQIPNGVGHFHPRGL